MRILGRWLLWLLLLAVVALVLVQGWYAAHILWWRDHAPRETAFMTMREAELREHGKQPHRSYRWVPYDSISPALKQAMIAAEDAKFVEHEGFDWDGIQQAIEKNYRRGRVVAGGSTITQQLAKNLFLSSQRSYWRKAEEALITLMLEAILEKRRIFELYLNVIEWGDGVFGAEAAARHYFGASAASLGPEPAARLAAMIPNPRFYDRNRDTAWLARKTDIILARMSAAELP